MSAQQVALFELDGQKHVGSGHHRKEEVAERHSRRAPEGDHESQIEGMANAFVESRHLKRCRRALFALQVIVGLLESEQIEVVYHERREQNEQPSEPEQALQHQPTA